MELRDFLEEKASERTERRAERRQEMLAKLTPEQREAIQRIENSVKEASGKNNMLRRRLLDAFPNMRSTNYEFALERIREEIVAKRKEKREEKRARKQEKKQRHK